MRLGVRNARPMVWNLGSFAMDTAVLIIVVVGALLFLNALR
jgi:hypothetical protein